MMKKMKYLLLLCLILSTVGAFTACGNKKKDVSDTSIVENDRNTTNDKNNGKNDKNNTNDKKNDNNNTSGNDKDSVVEDVEDAGKDEIGRAHV